MKCLINFCLETHDPFKNVTNSETYLQKMQSKEKGKITYNLTTPKSILFLCFIFLKIFFYLF